jgi:hypothetical protein
LLSYAEMGWNNHQDAVSCVRPRPRGQVGAVRRSSEGNGVESVQPGGRRAYSPERSYPKTSSAGPNTCSVTP